MFQSANAKPKSDRALPADLVVNSITALKQVTIPVVANVALTPVPPTIGHLVIDKATNHLYFSGSSGWVQVTNAP